MCLAPGPAPPGRLPAVSWILGGGGISRQEWVGRAPKFREKEIGIEMIPDLTNDELRELGVLTIGGRARLRKEAKKWMEESRRVEEAGREGTKMVREEEALEGTEVVREEGAQ